MYLINASGGDVKLTFDDASVGDGIVFDVKRIDNSSNIVTLDCNISGQTIDGAPSVTMAPGPNTYRCVVSNKGNWV